MYTKAPDFSRFDVGAECGSVPFLQRVEGLTEAMQTEFVRDIEIHISPGYELIPLPEGASYLGFIFAQGPDYERTYSALKSAHEKLRFVTRPKWEWESLAG